MKYSWFKPAFFLVLIPTWFLLASTIQAATINVTSSADDNSGCTLRNAVTSANAEVSIGGCTAGSGDDVIKLAAIGGSTITLATGPGFGEIIISDETSDSTTIEGAGVIINGGGATRIFVFETPSTLVNTIVNGGASAEQGGAISVATANSLEIRDSTVRNSVSTSADNAFGGGAIGLGSSTLIVKNSTFFNNSATNAGGAINGASGADIQLINTTFSGNSAAQGGGVYVGGAQLEIVQSTFSENQSALGGALLARNSPVLLVNSILANSVGGNDCEGIISTFTQGGVNLVENKGSCVLTVSPDLIESDPLLSPLSILGGPTPAHTPLDGSPAIDAGSDSDIPPGLEFDQRGPGFLRLAGLQVDLGSIEVQDPEQTGPDFVVTIADDTDDGLCRAAPGDCSLREALAKANADVDASTISFDSSLLSPAATVTLAGTALPTVTTEIAINAAGVTVDGDATSRLFAVGAGGVLTLRRMTLANGFNSVTGGAVNVEQGQLTIMDSTLKGNASNFGGAIYVFNSNVAFINSTLSGNSASTSGGGIWANGATVSLLQTTFSGNSSASGGGLLNVESTFTLTNSVVANSIGGGADCRNFDGSFTLLGVNLIENQGDCGIPGGIDLIQGIDPQLGVLGDNGGPTLTFLPAVTSPIVDAGDNSVIPVGLDFDQRGSGFPRIQGDAVDLGSTEFSDLIFWDGFESVP